MTEQALELALAPGHADPRGPAAEEAGGRRRGDALRRERHEAHAAALRREVGGKQNLLVLNDEAHHAYRIRQADAEQASRGRRVARRGARRGARARVDRLDRRPRPRSTKPPDQLLRRPLRDAVLPRAGRRGHEPDLPVGRQRLRADRRDRVGPRQDPAARPLRPAGEEQAAYFNIWRWIMSKLTARRARRQARQPEAGGGAQVRGASRSGCSRSPGRSCGRSGPRRATTSARRCSSSSARTRSSPAVIYELARRGRRRRRVSRRPTSTGCGTTDGVRYTIRVDSKVVAETEVEGAKNDESRWMRFTLDTVGKRDWTRDDQGRPGLPRGLRGAGRQARPAAPSAGPRRALHRQRRDADRGLGLQHGHAHRRPAAVHVAAPLRAGRRPRAPAARATTSPRTGKFEEEVAKILGVPFEVVPFKQRTGPRPRRQPQHHVQALPEKAEYAITFPRVEGYQQAIRNRVAVDWDSIAPVDGRPDEDPGRGAAEVDAARTRAARRFSEPGQVGDAQSRRVARGDAAAAGGVRDGRRADARVRRAGDVRGAGARPLPAAPRRS